MFFSDKFALPILSKLYNLLPSLLFYKLNMSINYFHPGIPIRTTLDNSTTMTYASTVHSLAQKARGVVRDIDPQNDLTFFRLRSKKYEIMVAPGELLI